MILDNINYVKQILDVFVCASSVKRSTFLKKKLKKVFIEFLMFVYISKKK